MLKIAIGMYEAQSIAIELENMTPERPLTHDLFKSLATEFNIELLEVVIYKLKEGVFFSNLVMSNGVITHEIDSRTSDAIALAVRFNCPVYTYNTILDQAGIVKEQKEDTGRLAPPTSFSKSTPEESSSPRQSKSAKKPKLAEFSSYSEEELNASLNRAIEDEAYELASKIRDEINKRKDPKIKE